MRRLDMAGGGGVGAVVWEVMWPQQSGVRVWLGGRRGGSAETKRGELNSRTRAKHACAPDEFRTTKKI